MLSKISVVANIIGVVLVQAIKDDENMLPMLFLIAGFVCALIDLVSLYTKTKASGEPFLKAIKKHIGSSISIVFGVFWILLAIF